MWLASPKKDHSNCKRKAKLPSEGAGKGILWPENDGKEIQKIWTGRKNIGTPAKYANILR